MARMCCRGMGFWML